MCFQTQLVMKFSKICITTSISLVLFTIIVIPSLAQNYTLGIKEGDKFSYEISKADQRGIKDVTGQDVDIPSSIIGVPIQIDVDTITDQGDYWEIKWGGLIQSLSYVTDTVGDTIEVSKTPNYNKPATIVCPLDVASYLGELYDGIPGVTVSNNVVTVTLDNGTSIYSYDQTTGMLDSFNLKNIEGQIVFELIQSTGNLIPGYSIWLILGILSAIEISIIILIRRRIKYNYV